jgi:hypothetical protein
MLGRLERFETSGTVVQAKAHQFVMAGFVRLVTAILAIASEAKQSSAAAPHWIASSLRFSQ